MDTTPCCERWGTQLAGQAVGGLCANCLLQLALELPAEPTGMVTELTHASAQPVSARPFGDHKRVEDVTVAPREAVGSRIGRYKLLQKIGEGGFGIVYLAEESASARSPRPPARKPRRLHAPLWNSSPVCRRLRRCSRNSDRI